jgi:small subunit ribosomal protein S15
LKPSLGELSGRSKKKFTKVVHSAIICGEKNKEKQRVISKEVKTKIVKDNQTHPQDSGSPEIQIALITERINLLIKHFGTHKGDFGSRNGLMKLVGQRKRLLEYLKKKDYDRYEKLIKKLGLRK